MGLLTQKIKEQKIPFDRTVIRIVSISDGKETTIRLIDAQYSTYGDIVDTIELPSFDGEYALAYSTIYANYLQLSLLIDKFLKSGLLFNN